MGCVVVRNRDESAAGPCTSSADSPADLSSSTVHFALGSAMLSILVLVATDPYLQVVDAVPQRRRAGAQHSTVTVLLMLPDFMLPSWSVRPGSSKLCGQPAR